MTKSIKRIFLILCSALCLLAMGIAIVSMPKKTAHAADTGAATYGLTLNDSVALRIYGSGGVRFSGSIDNASLGEVSEYGIILADEVTYHKNGELTMEKKNAVANDKSGLTTTVSGEKTNFSVALYGIKEKNIARNYVARGYVLVDGAYHYTDEVRANPYELAKRAYVENGITDNEVINDYLQRVVDVTVDENNTVSVNSPLADLTLLTDTISYDADQTLGWAGIDKQVAALYVNGTKVAAAYTDLALSTWDSVGVTMSATNASDGAAKTYDALLNVNGADFGKGSVTFDVSSVLPTTNWLSDLSATTAITDVVKYIESAYSAQAKSVALNSGEQTITLPTTDYDNYLRNYGANYLRIRLAFSNVGQSMTVKGLHNDQKVTLTADAVGENVLLTVNKTNELFAMYTATGENVYLGNLPQDVYFGNTALSLLVKNSASNASVEISPFFLSTSDQFNSVGDAVLTGADLSVDGGDRAPVGELDFVAVDGVVSHSFAEVGYKAFLQQIRKGDGMPTWRYWRVTLGGYQYTDYSSVTFYIANNIPGYNYYNERGALLFTATNEIGKVKIDNDGSVWFNGVKSENKMNSDGKIVFHIETTATHDSEGDYFGELHISNFLVLGDEGATVGTFDQTKISVSGIDSITDSSTTYANKYGVEQTSTLIDFTGGYGAYMQDVKSGNSSQWHRFYKMTLNENYQNYDSLSFYVRCNTTGTDVFVGDVKIIKNVATTSPHKITVMKDGLVLVDGEATTAYMKDGVIELYLDNHRSASLYYGEIRVSKALYLDGFMTMTAESDWSLVGVDSFYETAQTDTTYTANYGVEGWNEAYGMKLFSAYNQTASVNGTMVSWRYYRMTLDVDFRAADETSYYWVNHNGHNLSTYVYLQDGQLLTVMQPKTLMKFTIDREGYVYINDNAQAAGQIKTEEAIFYLDTHSGTHGSASNGYYGTLLLSNITQDGQVAVWVGSENYTSVYKLVGVAAESLQTAAKSEQYIVGAGSGFSFSGTANATYDNNTIVMNEGQIETAKTDGTNAVAHRIYRAIIGYDLLGYMQNASTEFYLSSNYENAEYFVNGVSLGKLSAANVGFKIKIDQNGFVYANASDTAATRIFGDFIVDIQMVSWAAYGRFRVSQNLWANGTEKGLDASQIKVWGIPAIWKPAAAEAEKTYAVHTGGGVFHVATETVKVTENGEEKDKVVNSVILADIPDLVQDGYKVDLGTVNGTPWDLYEITVNNPNNADRITLHLNASNAVDLYDGNKLLASLAANTWTQITFTTSGNVVFKVDTKGANVTLKTLAFAGVNLGAEKLDLSGNITVQAAEKSAILVGNWTKEDTNWAYNYQEAANVNSEDKVPLTIAYDYVDFGKVSFTLSSNVDGVSVYTSKNGVPVYDLTANTTVSFTVNNQGYLFANGAQVGRLTTSTTTLYIGIREIIATDYDYYTVYVGEKLSLAGSYSVVGDNEAGVGVTEDNLIENGVSNYVIVKGGSDEYIDFAAQEVQSVIEGATGVTLPIKAAANAGDNYILLGGKGVPTVGDRVNNPVNGFTTKGSFEAKDATDADRQEIGDFNVTKVLSNVYSSWANVTFDDIDLTTHDEWVFYARNDNVAAANDPVEDRRVYMALFNGGVSAGQDVFYMNAEGWYEYRLIRNPNGSYGEKTYNVYCNGELQMYHGKNRTVVELNGNANTLAWNGTKNETSGYVSKISYTDLIAIDRTPVGGVETLLADVGEGGYVLKTENKNIHVLANSSMGCLSGALDMLGYMVNYEAYADDAVYYDTGISTLPVPAFNHSFKPLIAERHFHEEETTNDDDSRLRMKLLEQRDEWGAWAHTTTTSLLPVEKYGAKGYISVESATVSNVTLDIDKFIEKMTGEGITVDSTKTSVEFTLLCQLGGWGNDKEVWAYYYIDEGTEKHLQIKHNKNDIMSSNGHINDYGISYSGEPSEGNAITVNYYPKATGNTAWYSADGAQICYGEALRDTATETGMYQTMLATVKEQLINYYKQPINAGKPSIYFSLGHADNNAYCNCNQCAAIMNAYGGATGGGYMAIQLQLANKIAEDIATWKEGVSVVKGKDIRFTLLAYGTSGRVVPTANMTIHKDVYVMYAPIESYYNVDIYNAANQGVYDRLKAWQNYIGRADGVIIYNYALNGLCYMFPTNNGAAGSFYDAYADNGISYVHTQGAGNKTASFEDLRIYVESKLMYDSKYSREELIKDFIMHYYDDAKNPTGSGEIMLKFYNELENYYAYLSRTTYDTYKNGTGDVDINSTGFNGYWHCDMFAPWDTHTSGGKQANYWTTARLKSFIDQIKSAATKIDESSLDGTTKATLKARVERELIFPMFASVSMSYANYYDKNNDNEFNDFDVKLTKEEKSEYVTKLQSLTTAIGMTSINEGDSLQYRNGLGIATNNVADYLNTLIDTGSDWYTKAD